MKGFVLLRKYAVQVKPDQAETKRIADQDGVL